MRATALLGPVSIVFASLLSGALDCKRAQDPVAIRGSEIYGRMCAVCHGAAGEGYKADNAPALANQAFLASASDAFLVSAIAHGRRGSTMSAWGIERGGPLPPADVNALLAFMRKWQKTHVTLDESPPRGDTARGEAAYTRECAACHGGRGVGGPNNRIGDMDFLATTTTGFLRHAIRHGRAGTPMKAFEGTLHEEGVEDVLTFIRGWQAPPAARELPPAARELPPAAPGRPPPLPLGPVPLNPGGPEPLGFNPTPGFTSADVIHRELGRTARMGILDARAPSDYLEQHIAGAVSVPFYDPDPYVADLPRDAWLVCYCGCPHAESGQLAQKLAAKGFTKVTVLDEGLGFWKNRKYETHTGQAP